MSTPTPPGYDSTPSYITPKVDFGWIGEAWQIYQKAWISWLLLYLVTIPFGVVSILYTLPQLKASVALIRSMSAGISVVPPAQTFSYQITTWLLDIASFIVVIFISSCASDIALRQVRGERIEPGSIFRGLRNALQMFLYWILFYIAVLVGELGCCIGINVSMGLLLPGFAMIADRESAGDTVTKSFARMKGDWLNAALFSFVYGLLSFLVIILTLDIASFILGPMTFIISALAYRDMVGFPPTANVGSQDNGFGDR